MAVGGSFETENEITVAFGMDEFEDYKHDRPDDRVEVTTDTKVYGDGMKCVSCNFIAIPPFYTCEGGHLYCESCGISTKRCVLWNKDISVQCGELVAETKCAFHEAVFLSSVFYCRNREYGCKDLFTGKQIVDGFMEQCPFNPLPDVANSTDSETHVVDIKDTKEDVEDAYGASRIN